MTGFDDEVSSWSEAWKASDSGVHPEAATLRSEIRRRTARFRAVRVFEAVLLASMLIWLLAFGISSSDPWDHAMIAAFVLLILACFVRGAQVVRQTWRPRAETTRAFIDLMIRRAETALVQLRLGWAVLAFEVVVFVPWIHHSLNAPGRETSPGSGLFAWGFLVLLASAAAVWIVFARRRTLADLERWQALRTRMSE